MIIAEQIASVLRSLGIRRVYGLPGEDHLVLLDSCAAAGLDYRAAYNESAAVIMAATEAQLTGLPGVAVLSLAPGVSNGINGLLNAYLDEVPLILISGQHPAGRLPLVVRQGFNIEQLVAPCTKWQARITVGMEVPSVVGKAVDESMSGRPGPVYLELPDEVAASETAAGEDAAAAAVTRLRSRWVSPAASRGQFDGGAAGHRASGGPEQAAGLLASRLADAEHPVLVLGGHRHRVTSETLAAFAARLRVPVLTSCRQKGVLDCASPYFAGTFLNGSLEARLLDRSDLVIMVDPEAFDFYNKPWCFTADAVALTDEAFTEWLNPFTVQLVSDPEAVLGALTARGTSASGWHPEDVAAYRTAVRESILPSGAAAFSVAHAVDAALDLWPKDGYLVADAGFSKPLVAMLSEPALPGRYLASSALSTMGYAIPAGIAAIRAGARPVLAFLGDGSLLMRGPELMAAAGEGAQAVFVAIMDRSLTQIEVKQRRRSLRPVGVTLPELSCANLAATFGIEGADVGSSEELREAVGKGLAAGGPVLIGAHVDPAPSRALFELLRG